MTLDIIRNFSHCNYAAVAAFVRRLFEELDLMMMEIFFGTTEKCAI